MKKSWMDDLRAKGEADGTRDIISNNIVRNREDLIQIYSDGLMLADLSLKRSGETVEAFNEIMDGRTRWMDTFNKGQIEAYAKGGKVVQCIDKCPYCCYQHVLLTSTEAFHIVRWMQSNGMEPDTKASADLVRDLSHVERYKRGIACPLLRNQRCSVYAVRPMPCRSYFSSTRHLCKQGWERRWHDDAPGTEVLSNPQLACHSMMLGTDSAFAMRGFQMVTLELADAISQASRPNAWEDWFEKKKPIFEVPADNQDYMRVIEAAMREMLI